MSWITAFRGFNHNSHSKGPACNLLWASETVTEKTQKRPFATLCWTYSPRSPSTKSHPGRWSWHREAVCPLRHLRTAVISELQPNIWDRVLLICVSLPYKYLFIPLTLPEESFHHWPLVSAASPGGGCLMFSFLASLGSFLSSHMKKGLHKHLFSLGRKWKAASVSSVSEITEFISISTIWYKNSRIDEESAETPAWNVHFVPHLIQSVHSYWLPTLILSNLQWGLLPYWPYMTQSSHLSLSHKKKKKNSSK